MPEHATHTLDVDAPTAAEAVPAAHSVHDAAFAAEAYDPAAHNAQLVAPAAEELPGVHAEHGATESRAADAYPAAHGSHACVPATG